MAEEFTINSSAIETKINQLLPSQGGFGAGVDFSASTMVIPIVDLTEAASGAGLREDLQKSLSHADISAFNVNNTTTTIINTTGYFRVFGNCSMKAGSPNSVAKITISDGSTIKSLVEFSMPLASAAIWTITPFDFIVFLTAGDSLAMTNNNNGITMSGCTRQIASIDGVLNNPS